MSNAVPVSEGVATGRAPVLLQATTIRKHYGATAALRGVDLAVRAGEVHALLGQNGAGKSTLVRILCGAVRPDAGTIALDGGLVELHSVRDAVRSGIVPVYQQLSLIPDLTVLENIAAFDLAEGWALRPTAVASKTEAATLTLAQVGLDVSLKTPVRDLKLWQRQLVEIARALATRCRVLILDEPTASADKRETDRLFVVIRSLCARGIGVLYISHRLDEVRRIAQRVTVLRDGVCVLEGQRIEEIGAEDVIAAMVGSRSSNVKDEQPAGTVGGRIVYRACHLAAPSAFDNVSLEVHQGEVVGIAGLTGSGAIELGLALAGAYPITSGTIQVNGRRCLRMTRSALAKVGVGLVPLDRDKEGVFPRLSVLANVSVQSLRALSIAGFVKRGREKREVGKVLVATNVVPRDESMLASRLSGGNLQKVVCARNLMDARIRVLVALEPSRGVDIEARRQLRDLLASLAAQGKALLIVSSDPDELSGMCNRIIVMRNRCQVAEVSGLVSQTELLARMTGAHDDPV